MALENSPVDARGLMSGVLQQGYSFGYVCAACAVLGFGDAADSWKSVFWVAAGLSIGVGILRCFFPDSQQFIEARKAGKNKAHPSQFWKETKIMLGQEWKMCIYCIILMTWFNCKLSNRLCLATADSWFQIIATRPRITIRPSCSRRRSLRPQPQLVRVFS